MRDDQITAQIQIRFSRIGGAIGCTATTILGFFEGILLNGWCFPYFFRSRRAHLFSPVMRKVILIEINLPERYCQV
jgi:hypothetical protein